MAKKLKKLPLKVEEVIIEEKVEIELPKPITKKEEVKILNMAKPVCPYCGVADNAFAMKKYHLNNCKQFPKGE